MGGEEQAQRPGEGEHPLAHRRARQYGLDQMRGRLHHAPRPTRGAPAAALSTEGDQVLVAAPRARGANETSFQASAAEVGLELLANEAWQARLVLVEMREERLDVGLDHKATLVRTAFNPVIYEVLDFGISMYDRNLELIAEAPGLTMFLGANDYSVNKVVEYMGVDAFESGDVVISNYPYWNAAHTYDVSLIGPVFVPGLDGPFGFLCVRGRQLAQDPGSAASRDSSDDRAPGIFGGRHRNFMVALRPAPLRNRGCSLRDDVDSPFAAYMCPCTICGCSGWGTPSDVSAASADAAARSVR